ncbi:sulfate ABC transporter substrate-binding protein [Vulcanococcus limneticus]|uniref:sulfate ABC transporter substrate-binding protein n=1 Tax=Vulcanococcus limneticus TaxID=2170428 RepID=UPI00398BFD67
MVYLPSSLPRRLGAGLAVAALTVTGVSGLISSPVQAQAKKPATAPAPQEILLVSYAVTKAAYDKIIPLFAADWKKKTGQTVTIKGSYGGSGSQTRAVIDGLEADIVGLAMAADVSKIQQAGLIKSGWESRLPNNAVATNSTVVAFIRPGNPKKINGWKDLDNKDVDNVLANPKTSGGARWNYVALWGSVTEQGGNEAAAKKLITGVYKNAEVLPKDAREATDTFVKRKKGDVLLNWETEAILAKRNGEWKTPYKIFSPNVLTEMPIAVVDKNVDKKGTRKVAEAFARFLFTAPAQKAFADNGFRPVTAEGKAYAKGRFQDVKFFRIGDLGGWPSVDKKHFSKGGVWDQIFSQTR